MTEQQDSKTKCKKTASKQNTFTEKSRENKLKCSNK